MRVTLRTPPLKRQSGTTRHAVALAEGLRKAGAAVAVEQELHFEMKLGSRWIGGDMSARLGRLWPPRRADVVHATTLYCNPTLRSADVVTVHDVMPVSHPELYGSSDKGVAKMLAKIRRVLRRGCLHVTTRHVQAEIEEYVMGADRALLPVVPHGLDHGRFFPDPGPDPALFPGRMNILVVAQHERRKRVDVLLEAVRDLPFVRVLQVGPKQPPPLHQAMAAKVWEAAAPLVTQGRYEHLGVVDDPRLRRLLSSADVVVAPSVAEGFGWPPLEALACGAKVVASDIPPHREVLGDAVRYSAVDALLLQEGLDNLWDGEQVREELFPPMAERLAQAGKYTWERHIEGMLGVYEMAAGRR